MLPAPASVAAEQGGWEVEGDMSFKEDNVSLKQNSTIFYHLPLMLSVTFST